MDNPAKRQRVSAEPTETRAFSGLAGPVVWLEGVADDGGAALLDLLSRSPMRTAERASDEPEYQGWCDRSRRAQLYSLKERFAAISPRDFQAARARCNEYEGLGKGLFVNRSAMKLVNLDRSLGLLASCYQKCRHQPAGGAAVDLAVNATEANDSWVPLTFVDICGAPGGNTHLLPPTRVFVGSAGISGTNTHVTTPSPPPHHSPHTRHPTQCIALYPVRRQGSPSSYCGSAKTMGDLWRGGGSHLAVRETGRASLALGESAPSNRGAPVRRATSSVTVATALATCTASITWTTSCVRLSLRTVVWSSCVWRMAASLPQGTNITRS
mmetsp:Transcript_104414/g.300895  ORF Transcript_104414/g.300895 Transcript_104414/m.300895 type:complete len:326 (+) Transcript_104414:45-1022(+)